MWCYVSDVMSLFCLHVKKMALKKGTKFWIALHRRVIISMIDMCDIFAVPHYLMTNHIKLATTAGLVTAVTLLFYSIGGADGVLHIHFDKAKAASNFRRLQSQFDLDGVLNAALLTFCASMGWYVVKSIGRKIIDLGRRYLMQLCGGLLLVIWIVRRAKDDTQIVKKISPQFVYGILIGYIFSLIAYRVAKPASHPPEVKRISEVPLRVGQVEHVIKKDMNVAKNDVPIIALLMKRIHFLEEKFDHSMALVQPAEVQKRRIDEQDTDDEIEVYLTDEDLKDSSKRLRRDNQSTTSSQPRDEPNLLEVAGKKRSKSIQLPARRQKPLKVVNPKPRLPKNRERCPHCGDYLVNDHKCWVVEKAVKCFKCGGPNHFAVACKSRGHKIQMDILNKMDEGQIEREITRLNRLLVLRRKRKETENTPLKGHVIRQQTQSEIDRLSVDRMESHNQRNSIDTVFDDEPFLFTPPQLTS